VIVVVGQPLYAEPQDGNIAGGLPARIAIAAAAGGAIVQLVGKAGEDSAGDAIVMALAQRGVGHVALLRDAGRPTPRAGSVPGESTADEAGPLGSAIEPEDPDAPAGAGTAPPPDPADDAAVLDAADVDLALRYLTDFGVVVVADPVSADVFQVVTAAAAWAGARTIVVVPAGEVEPAGLPPDAIVFEAPDIDLDGAFAALVGAFAAALDDGGDPAAAFRSTVDEAGWTATPAD
jgi:hypothetical protein